MTAETPQQSVYVRCASCQHLFATAQWSQDVVCTECGAKDTSPVPVYEGAVEYSLAGRTTGPTIEDLRLARIVRWLGLAQASLLQELLREQVRTAAEKGQAPALGELLLREKALTSPQLGAILRAIRVEKVPTGWQRFGEYAVRANLLTRDQLEECSKIQLDLVQRGMEFPFIGHLMIEMGFCKEGQVYALLASQKNRLREGFLHEMEEAVRHGVAPTGGVAQLVRPSGKVFWTNLLFAAGSAVLLVLTVFGWTRASEAGGLLFGTACPACRFHEPEFCADPGRASCPKCRKALLPCVVCTQCRALVAVTRAGDKRCPSCGADSFVRWVKGMPVGALSLERKP